MTYAAMSLGFNPPSYTIAYAQSTALNFTVPAGKTKMAVVFIASGASATAGTSGSSGGGGGGGGRGGGGVCFADFTVVAGENFTVPAAGSFIRNNDSFVLANVNAGSGSSTGNASINASTVANQKVTVTGSQRGVGGTAGTPGGAGGAGTEGGILNLKLDGIGDVVFRSGSGGGGGGGGAIRNIPTAGGTSGGGAGTGFSGAGGGGTGGSAFANSNTGGRTASAGGPGSSATVTNPLSNAPLNTGLGGGGSGGGGGGGRYVTYGLSGSGGGTSFVSSMVIRIYFA